MSGAGGNLGGAAAQQQNNNIIDNDGGDGGDGGMNAGEFMDLPAEEMDMELQRVLEMSRNDK